MANLSIKRVLALPGTVDASTIYIVKAVSSNHVELYFTSSDGLETRRVLTTADVEALINASAASSASTLTTARNIAASGDATWSVSFDGSDNVSGVLTLATTGVIGGTYTKVTVDTKGRVTTASNLTASDIPNLDASKIVSGTLTVDTTGNAATATTAAALTTPRNINGVAFDGSSDITINAVDATARIAASEKGAINGVATLDETGKVPANQLPSYVDDVVEFDDEASLPVTGESGKIYITIDNNYSFRWTGSAYTRIGSDVSTADSAVKLTTARSIAASGDATWSVNFDGSANVSGELTLATTGVTSGTYTKVTVDAKGRVTTATNLTAADIPSLDSNKVTSAATITLAAAEW